MRNRIDGHFMNAKMRKLKIVTWVLTLLLAIFVLPVFPKSIFLTEPDPQSKKDLRIKLETRAALSDEDVQKIIDKVRGRGYINLCEALLGKLGITNKLEPVLMIILTSNEGNFIQVDTGYICGSLCGNGTSFYLNKFGNDWTVINHSSWVS